MPGNNSLHEQMRRRALQLQTAAEVSRAASSILDLEELLPRVVDLIRERFDLYYVGLFLIKEVPRGKEAGRWAVLRAGTGQAGQKMIQAGHKLAVGGESMIGRCVASGQALIALDVGEEAVRFDNPLLPLTRSEMALPLISRGRIIGAMTIQSDQPAAFSDEDITVLQTMADQLANAIENAHLFQERERRITELAIINEIGQALSTALELDELLETVHRQVSRLFDTTNFYIATYEEGDDHWTTAFHLEHGQRQPPARYSIASGLTGHIIRTRQPILFHSVAENIAFHQALGREMIGEIAHSWLGVPLLTADKLVGVMAIQNYEHEFLYTEQDLALFSTVAAQVANALDNHRLLAETRRRARELEVINEVGQAITSVLDLDSVLLQIVDAVKERFGYFFVGILLVEGDQLVFRSGSFVGHSGIRWERGDIRLSLSDQSLNVAVVTGGQPILVNDISTDPRYKVAEGLEPIHAELDVPIMVKGQIIGTLTVQSDHLNAFDQTDLRLLQALANQAGVAIENARLYREAQNQITRTQLLLDASEETASTVESTEIMRRIARATARALGADTTSIYILDETGERLQPVAGYHVPPSMLETYRQTPVVLREHPFIQEAIEKQRTVFSHDLPHDLADNPVLLQFLPARSLLATPIAVKGKSIGLLFAIWWEEAHVLTREEQILIEGLLRQGAIAIQNAYLLEETQNHARELAVLNEMGTALTAMLDTEAVIENLYHYTARLMDTTNFFVALYEPTTDTVSFPVALEHGQRVQWRSRQAGRGLTEYVIRTGKPLLIREGIGSWLEQHGLDAIGQTALSWLGVPMKIGERVLGVIAVQSYETPRLLGEHHRDLLSAVASHAAIALENARLFAETNRHAAQLQSLYVTAVRLSTERSTPDLLQLIVEQATSLLEAEAGGFYLYDPTSHELVFSIGTGYFTDFVGYRLKPGEGLAGQVFENRHLMTVEDYQSWPGRAGLYEGETRLRTLLGVPLLGREGVLGVLEIAASQQKPAFSTQDTWLAELFATQAAIALENTRLFEQTQAALAQTEALYYTSRLITAAQSVDEVLVAVLGYAHRFDLDRCLIALLDDPDAAPADRQVEVQAIWDRAGREAAYLGNRFTPAHIPPIGTLGPTDRLIVDDFTTSDQVDERTRATFRYLGVGAAAIIPLAVGDRLLGWLLVEAIGRPYSFTGQMVDALHSIAGQAAVALQNLSRLQEIQARAEQERAGRAMLALRVREVSCLNDIGRKIDETPPVPEFLHWAAERIPAAMQYPDLCRAAIEFEGQVYGAAEAIRLPRQMVQQMRIGGEAVGRVYVAYTEDYDFLDEESALLGDITRRVSGYIENRRLIDQIQARVERERHLRTITDRIRQGASTEAILRIGLEELSQVLGASQCIVRLGPRDQLLAGQPAPWSEVQPSAGAERRSDGRRRQGEKDVL